MSPLDFGGNSDHVTLGLELKLLLTLCITHGRTVLPLGVGQATLGVCYCLAFVTLHASCAAVYCNRSCLWVCLFVCGSVTAIIRNCVHQSLPNWVCR